MSSMSFSIEGFYTEPLQVTTQWNLNFSNLHRRQKMVREIRNLRCQGQFKYYYSEANQREKTFGLHYIQRFEKLRNLGLCLL